MFASLNRVQTPRLMMSSKLGTSRLSLVSLSWVSCRERPICPWVSALADRWFAQHFADRDINLRFPDHRPGKHWHLSRIVLSGF